MSDASIFVLHDDGRLVPMSAEPYASEDVLQDLVARYPSLIPQPPTGPEPRRWLLVAREHGIPDSDGGGDRWSLDHLFLDQDGVPTLVEVKRSTDTRIRREVVGQMLDYAANAVRYWPVDQLRDTLQRTLQSSGDDVDAAVARLVDDQIDVEEYWRRVDANLRSGRIRMVFLADRIPSELRRIVEFLNEQMRSAEVLAVELQHFRGDGARTIVPRLIGATSNAEQAKGASPKPPFEDVRAAADPAIRRLDEDLCGWAPGHQLTIAQTHRARQFRDGPGSAALTLYFDIPALEFDFSLLRDAGLEEDIDGLLHRLEALSGKRLTRVYPLVPAAPLAAAWDELSSELLPRYLRARLQARSGAGG